MMTSGRKTGRASCCPAAVYLFPAMSGQRQKRADSRFSLLFLLSVIKQRQKRGSQKPGAGETLFFSEWQLLMHWIQRFHETDTGQKGNVQLCLK
jgi:hypothetical protein